MELPPSCLGPSSSAQPAPDSPPRPRPPLACTPAPAKPEGLLLEEGRSLRLQALASHRPGPAPHFGSPLCSQSTLLIPFLWLLSELALYSVISASLLKCKFLQGNCLFQQPTEWLAHSCPQPPVKEAVEDMGSAGEVWPHLSSAFPKPHSTRVPQFAYLQCGDNYRTHLTGSLQEKMR